MVALTAGEAGVASAASNAWLPSELRIAAVLIYVVIMVVLLWHLREPGRHARVWDAGHLLIALGMIDMFVPVRPMIVAAEIGRAVFAAATLGVVGFLASRLVRGGRPDWLCPLAGVDLAAMAYMFAMPIRGYTWLTGLLVGWCVLQAVGWVTRIFFVHTDLGDSTAAAGSSHGAHSGGTAHNPSVWIALTVMNLGMAYMLLAMSRGTAMVHEQLVTTGSMPGM